MTEKMEGGGREKECILSPQKYIEAKWIQMLFCLERKNNISQCEIIPLCKYVKREKKENGQRPNISRISKVHYGSKISIAVSFEISNLIPVTSEMSAEKL